MWQAEYLKLQNFFSHKSTEYKFMKNKCVMVYGDNQTDSGSDSNGAGKSILSEGLTIAYTGETCRDINKEDFINDDANECFVEHSLYNAVIKQRLVIQRWYYRNKSSKVVLIENGKVNEQITGVPEANKRIYELIGISREDLLHFFLIGQSTNHSFFTAGDGEKKEIISRFTNADLIDRIIEHIKSERALKDSSIDVAKSAVEKINTKIELLNDSLEYEKENGSSTIKEAIKRIGEEIIEREESLKEEQIEIDKYKKENKEVDKSVLELTAKLVDTEKTEKIIKKIKEENKTLDDELDEAVETQSSLKSQMGGKVKCPKCNNEFIPDSNLSIKEINESLAEIEELKTSINETITENKAKIKEKQKLIDSNSEIELKINRFKNTIRNNKSNIENSETNIDKINKKIETLKGERTKKKEELNNNTKIADLQSEIKTNEGILAQKEKSLKVALKEVEDYDYWIHNFGKKGFQTYLANQSVKTLEGMVNSYLKKINTNLSVIIDGYSILKNGDIREKISIYVLKNGIVKKTFNRHSGGEKARINVSGILSLQRLINMSAKNGGLNLLILDEVFEGLDTSGQIEALNILSNTGITTLIVSHNNNSIGAENEIVIEKIGGESFILAN